MAKKSESTKRKREPNPDTIAINTAFSRESIGSAESKLQCLGYFGMGKHTASSVVAASVYIVGSLSIDECRSITKRMTEERLQAAFQSPASLPTLNTTAAPAPITRPLPDPASYPLKNDLLCEGFIRTDQMDVPVYPPEAYSDDEWSPYRYAPPTP